MKESAGNLSPAPPQWTKGPGVSAGRNYRVTGACPTVVSHYLRKVGAARSFATEALKSRGKSRFFSNGRILDGGAAVAPLRLLSSFRYQNRRPAEGAGKAWLRSRIRRVAGFAKSLRSWYIGRSDPSESDLRKLRNQICP